jgi:hypothetical protein
VPKGFVARELEHINERLRHPEGLTDEQREQLCVAQQALEWALDPLGARSPFDYVTGVPPIMGNRAIRGIRAGSADCLPDQHPDRS